MGFWQITLLFLLLEVVLAGIMWLLGKKSENQLNQLLVATSVVCCWLMWAIIYIAQLHPLVRPVLQA
eukprot:jgi/Botrbrau1/22526/Bobra.114_2s0050.1